MKFLRMLLLPLVVIITPGLCKSSIERGSSTEELVRTHSPIPTSSATSVAPSGTHFHSRTSIIPKHKAFKDDADDSQQSVETDKYFHHHFWSNDAKKHNNNGTMYFPGKYHNQNYSMSPNATPLFDFKFEYLDSCCNDDLSIMSCTKNEDIVKNGERLLSTKDLGTYNNVDTKCEADHKNGQIKNDSIITLGLLSPFNQNRLILGAMRLAVERVNANPKLLPGHTLRYITADIQRSDLLPIKIMTEMRDRGTVGFIGGPEDTCVSEALVAAAWNLPLISFKCSDHRVSDKNTYSTFARTLPSSSKVSKSVVALLKEFNWNKVVLVVCHLKKESWYKIIIDAFTNLGKKHNIDITDHYSLPDYIPENFPEMEKIVKESFPKTRVYVFIGEHVALVHLMRALANKRAFDNGEYIVISIDDKLNVTGKFFDVGYLDPYLGNNTKDMIKAYRSLLKLVPSNTKAGHFGEYEKDLIMMKYSTHYPFCSPYHPRIFGDVQFPVEEAAYLYDAVMIYARAFHEILENGSDTRNGTAVFERIRNRSYSSIQGYDVFMDENGDAEGNYTVVSLLPVPEDSIVTDENSTYDYWDPQTNSTVMLSMQPVGYFAQGSPPSSSPSPPSSVSDSTPPGQSPTSMSGSLQGGEGNHNNNTEPETPADDIAAQVFRYINNSKQIHWVGGKPPKAEPSCGFKNERCVYKPDWKTISLCSIAAAVLAVGFVMAGRHYRYEQKLACLLWKIDMQHVIVISPGPPEPVNGTKSTVAICRQLLSTTVETEPPLEVPCKKAYTRIGFYKGMVVAVKPIYKKSIDLTRNIRKELIQIREVRHENIIPFIGASVDHGNICILTAYSARGSLEDVLQNEDLHLDNMFLASLVADLLKGMIYLHESEIISHGNLKSSNCLVDSRWVLQIADFGLHEFKAGQENRGNTEKEIRKLLWRAPELLRDLNSPARGTQKGDVYSFGIVLYEMIGRCGPWGKTQLSVPEIIERVTNPEMVDSSESDTGYLRPSTLHLDCGETILKCLEACWEEEPDLRPDFRFIRVRLKEMQAGLKPNIFDNMLSIMEKYACNLEDLVQERTIQLMEEKKKTDALLHRMLPKSVADSLKLGAPVEAESFDSVSIYFSDIVGFTAFSAVSTPLQVVELLNDLYTCFDSIISNYDVYKVETIGDGYMVVSGLPIRNGIQHAGEIASMALHLLDRIKSFEIRHRPGERLKLRIGIHTGCVVAGVVGIKMPRYCLFGDSVNVASRMESNGLPLKIHISSVTKKVLEQIGGYYYEERGIIPIKGKGEMRTFWLTGEDPTRTRKNSTDSNTLSENGEYQDQGERSPPKSGVIGFGQEGGGSSLDLNSVAITNNNLKAFTCENALECHANANQGYRSDLSPSENEVGVKQNGSHAGFGKLNESSPTKESLVDLSPTASSKGNSGINHSILNGKPPPYKPTTWLLAESQNGKVDHHGNLLKGIGGKYVSCSNVFQECKVNIIKELRKNGNTAAAAAAAAAFTSTNGRIGNHFQHSLRPCQHQPGSANRFRSAPIITFMETSAPNPGTAPLFAFEERNFV